MTFFFNLAIYIKYPEVITPGSVITSSANITSNYEKIREMELMCYVQKRFESSESEITAKSSFVLFVDLIAA